jgi:hypothetical protein
MPQNLEPPIYLDPFVKAGGLFSRLEVTLDGVRIAGPSLEECSGHYQHVNRLFCTEKIRREKFGDQIFWMSNSNDKKYVQGQDAVQGNANPYRYTAKVDQVISKNLKACMKPLMFEAADVSQPNVSTFGSDAFFPLSTQCNSLRTITGQKNSNSFLHPTLKASFALVKAGPDITACIERADVSDTEFFSDVGGITAPALHPAVTVTIKSVTLFYQSLTLADPLEIAKHQTKVLKYYCDLPTHRTNTLATGTTHDVQKVLITPGSRLLYLFFVKESQYRPESRANSFFSCRFKFPPGLDQLHLNLLGRENLIFARGFQGLGSTKCRNSPSARTYVTELQKAGLYSKGMDDFFPPSHADTHAYDNVILIDLFPYASALKEMATLEVILTYSEAAKLGWKLKTICVSQVIHEWNPEKKWTSTPMI